MPSTIIRIRRMTRNKSVGSSSSFHPIKRPMFSRRSILGGANSRSSKRTTDNDDYQLSETLFRVDETDGSSSSSFVEDIDCFQSTLFLRTCIELLSDDNNKEKNEMGLKKLLNPPSTKVSNYKRIISKAIVYGGSKDSIEQDLRSRLRVFLSFDGENSVFSDYEDDDDDDYDYDNRDELDEGRIVESDTTLYFLSLQLVAHSLEWILSLDSEDHEPIDFRDPFMRFVISTIVQNIEIVPGDAEITGLALKCLRLLHSLEPILVKPMLQLSLMPYLIHLRDFGQQEKFPSIESEASRLIERGDIKASRFIEI